MAENEDIGVNDGALINKQPNQLITQFVNAEQFNQYIDQMFKPVVARIQKETGKKDFSLFSLFFNNTDTNDIKKYVKDNITKIIKNIKAETFVSPIISKTPANNLSNEIKPIEKQTEKQTLKIPTVKPIEKQILSPTNKSNNIIETPISNKLLEHIDNSIKDISKQLNNFQNIHKSIFTTITKRNLQKETKIQPKTTKDLLESKNAINVNIVGINDNVIKKLNGILKLPEEKQIIPTIERPSSSNLLEKLIGAALAGFSAYKFLQAAWDNKGPLKGAMELLGLVLTKAATSLFKGVLDGIKVFIKLLPESISKKLIGENSLTNKVGTLLVSSLSKITSNIGGVLSRIGSIFIGALAKLSPVSAKAVSFLAGGLSKLSSEIGTFLFKRIKVIPFIGPLISFAFGIKRMTQGDYFGGIIEVLGGLVGLIPGLSFIAPFITDLFLAGYDIKSGGIEKEKNNATNQWIKNFGQALLDTGPIKWLVNIGGGLGKLFIGDFSGGIADLANALTNIPGVEYILDLLGAKKTKEGNYFEAKDYNIIDKLKNEISDKLQTIFNWGKNIIDSIRKFFHLNINEKLPSIETDTSKAVDLRKKIAELKDKEKEEQNKQYLLTNTKAKNLNEITTERTSLENQLDNIIQKVKAAKTITSNKTPTTSTPNKTSSNIPIIEPASESEIQYDNEPIIVSNPTNNIEEIRKTSLASSSKNNDTDKIVSAINDLKINQTAQQPKSQPKPETKALPISVVSSITNSFKPIVDINVDTARDSIFIARNGMRNYLFNQRLMI